MTLSAAAKVRLVAVASVGRGVIEVQLVDGQSGRAIPNAMATLSGEPSPPEVDAAVEALLGAALVYEPALHPHADDDTPSWYTTWWGVSLIGVAVAAAATTTTLVVLNERDTEYRFEP